MLELVARAGRSGASAIQHSRASSRRATGGGSSGAADQVAAAGVDVVGEHDGDRHATGRPARPARRGSRWRRSCPLAAGRTTTSSPGPQARRSPPGPPSRGSRWRARPTGPGAAGRPDCGPSRPRRCSRWVSIGGPSYHGAAPEFSTTLSPCRAETGTTPPSGDAEPLHQLGEVALDGAEALASSQSMRSILLTQRDHVADPELRRQVGVAARLLEHAVAGVDQHDGDVGGRGAGDHVARVADVAWVSAMMNERRGVAKKRYATSIVMPCSRSARRPSVSCARSTSASATWSAISDLES